MNATDLLARQLDDAYEFFRERVDGLTDDEFWWEPAPDSWTVERKPDGRWWVFYPDFPHPDPAPFTTIAWRLVHVAECKIMYHEYAFGAGALIWPEIDSAHSPAAAINQLDEGQALLKRALASLTDEELDEPRMTNWGEEWPAWQVFWTMIHHDYHHGGEIGALRDLYRVTGAGLAPTAAGSQRGT